MTMLFQEAGEDVSNDFESGGSPGYFLAIFFTSYDFFTTSYNLFVNSGSS